MAFSSYESEQIRKALLKEARRWAVTAGMRKTSVEQLTEAVGISKGSFYKFYESKELLFFAVLEDIHTELYEVARKVLAEQDKQPEARRAEMTLLAVCRQLSDTGAMHFIENDAEYLLRRLPLEVKTEHYHDDETHICTLLQESGLMPQGGIPLAAAVVRGLILTVSHQEEIGALYPEVLQILVRGAMQELFPDK